MTIFNKAVGLKFAHIYRQIDKNFAPAIISEPDESSEELLHEEDHVETPEESAARRREMELYFNTLEKGFKGAKQHNFYFKPKTKATK